MEYRVCDSCLPIVINGNPTTNTMHARIEAMGIVVLTEGDGYSGDFRCWTCGHNSTDGNVLEEVITER